MGRTIVYDELINSSLAKCAASQKPHCGLLIGSSTSQRDIIIHITPTPDKEEFDRENDNVLDDDRNKNEKSKPSKKFKEYELDEAWICQHARQVTRMLPGGLDVLGIYIYGPSELATKNTANLRQILFAMFKSISKDQQLGFCSKIKDRIQLQLCSITNKATCRTYDISDYKSAAKPAEWKALTSPIQWSQIDTEYNLDQWIPISSDRSKQNLLKQIQISLEPFCTAVNQAVALIDGRLREGTELLTQSSGDSGKRGKHKEKPSAEKLTHNADIFLLMNANNNALKDSELINCGATMEVKGTFHCRAFIPSKSTVEEAILALKQDVIRSMTSRCEIHCEDMLFINEEQQDPSLVHELPRRVYTQLPGTDISVSDYVYHGDLAKDSLEAFQELLNLQLTEEDIDTSFEQARSSPEFSEPDMEERLSEAGEQVIEAISSRRNIILPTSAALITLAVAAAVSYFVVLDN